MSAQEFKKLPPSELLWLTENTSGGIFYITSNKTRDTYYIYKQNQNSVSRLGKGKSPAELESKFIK